MHYLLNHARSTAKQRIYWAVCAHGVARPTRFWTVDMPVSPTLGFHPADERKQPRTARTQ
jgi:hypothetical protein